MKNPNLARRLPAAIPVLALAAASLSAQPLDSLVRRVQDLHPSVQSARLALRQADARAESAGAWQPPSIGIQVSMLPPGEPNPLAAGETMLMVEQMIPLFGQNTAMVRAEALAGAIGDAEVLAARRDLRARVEREYYTLWLLERRAGLVAESRRQAELLYGSAEARYATGRSARSDLDRMAIEAERLATEEGEIRLEHAAALARMNALLLRPLDTPVEIPAALETPELPPFDSLAVRLEDHPDLQRMKSMAEMAGAEAQAQDAMLRPMLMLRGGISWMPDGHPVRYGSLDAITGGQMSGGHGMTRLGLNAGAMLTLPLAPWSRSGPAGLAEAYRIEAEQQLLQRDAMRRDMLGMLRSAYARAQRAALRLHYHRDTQGRLLDDLLESTLADYTNDRIPFSSVVDAYRMRLMAYMDAYMQEMEYAMEISMIMQLTGELP